MEREDRFQSVVDLLSVWEARVQPVPSPWSAEDLAELSMLAAPVQAPVTRSNETIELLLSNTAVPGSVSLPCPALQRVAEVRRESALTVE